MRKKKKKKKKKKKTPILSNTNQVDKLFIKKFFFILFIKNAVKNQKKEIKITSIKFYGQKKKKKKKKKKRHAHFAIPTKLLNGVYNTFFFFSFF